MRSGLAIVLTGKGYKEHHWLVVPHQPLQLSPLTLLPLNAFFFLYYPRHPEPIQHWPCCHLSLRSNRQLHQHWSGHYIFHVQRGRVSCKYLFQIFIMCTKRFCSMLMMRTGLNTLPLSTSIVGRTPMTQIKTGLKISTVKTLFMPSAEWPIASWLVTGLIPINAPPFTAVLFVTTWAKKRLTLYWSWPWSMLGR